MRCALVQLHNALQVNAAHRSLDVTVIILSPMFAFLFIKYMQLVDETFIKIKIQFVQNEIRFKERLSTKQNLMKW